MSFKYLGFILLSIVVSSIFIQHRTAQIELSVNSTIEKTIRSLIPPQDTSRRTVARPLTHIGKYHYLNGRTNYVSKRIVDMFEFSPDLPTEIWEGYITQVIANNGAKYYLWSTNKIEPQTPISVWVVSDQRQWEIGYSKNDKDKVYAQIVYPIAAIKKPNSIGL